MRSVVLAATAILLATAAQAQPWPPIEKCVPGQPRAVDEYCLVDGDTIWIDGERLRMVGYDTPEPQTQICGGAREIELAHRASDRVVELLNSSEWTAIIHDGTDNTGARGLVTIFVEGRDLGEILIEEDLAREWPDGYEWWCEWG